MLLIFYMIALYTHLLLMLNSRSKVALILIFGNRKETISANKNYHIFLSMYAAPYYFVWHLDKFKSTYSGLSLLIEQTPLKEWIFNLTPKLEIYWKYCGKEEKLLLRSNFSSFPQYFVACW